MRGPGRSRSRSRCSAPGGPGHPPRPRAGHWCWSTGSPASSWTPVRGRCSGPGSRGWNLSALDTILLTHLHTDHAVELPSFATVRSLDGSGTTALRVFGPDRNAGFPSTRAFVAALLGPGGAFRYVRHFGAELTIEATNIPAGPRAAPKQIPLGEGLVVTARGHHHGDAPAVAYRIEHAGRSVVLAGDVDPSGLLSVEELSSGADLLVISCAVLDPPESPPGLYQRHSPPSAIGAMAARAHVKALLCTHLPPAVNAKAEVLRASLARPSPVR